MRKNKENKKKKKRKERKKKKRKKKPVAIEAVHLFGGLVCRCPGQNMYLSLLLLLFLISFGIVMLSRAALLELSSDESDIKPVAADFCSIRAARRV